MNRESRRKLALEKLDELEVIYGNIVNIPDNELIAVRLMLDSEWSPKSIEKTSANKLITMKKDEWKAIPEYEGYFISDEGTVVKQRKNFHDQGWIIELVKEVKDIQPRVRLRKGNSSNRLLVKQLLASAWLGIPYGSAEILPKNRDEEDVRLENLEVVPLPTT